MNIDKKYQAYRNKIYLMTNEVHLFQLIILNENEDGVFLFLMGNL